MQLKKIGRRTSMPKTLHSSVRSLTFLVHFAWGIAAPRGFANSINYLRLGISQRRLAVFLGSERAVFSVSVVPGSSYQPRSSRPTTPRPGWLARHFGCLQAELFALKAAEV